MRTLHIADCVAPAALAGEAETALQPQPVDYGADAGEEAPTRAQPRRLRQSGEARDERTVDFDVFGDDTEGQLRALIDEEIDARLGLDNGRFGEQEQWPQERSDQRDTEAALQQPSPGHVQPPSSGLYSSWGRPDATQLDGGGQGVVNLGGGYLSRRLRQAEDGLKRTRG